ncbi:hypothetical protein BRD00_04215 [Halobacteriales archaeon QS_8_69_26]|nr:MAG: hypothetical protein BRD00_04215 [Halobacteriales archaeon QS_8_69_26]
MSALRRLWALREDRPALVYGTLAVLAFFAVYPVLDRWLRGGGVAVPFEYYDWGALSGGVDRWYRGEVVYWKQGDFGYHASYLYLPAYLLAFVPFFELQQTGALTWLPIVENPFDVGAVAWNTFTFGLLWVGLQLVIAECGLRLRLYERALLAWLLLGFQPLLYSVKLGQASSFLAAMFCFAFVAMERGEAGDDRQSRLVSGALTTVGSAMKPFYATSGAHLLRDRDRFTGAVVGGLVLVALSFGVFGVENHLTYLDVLAWGKGWGTDPAPPWLWHAGYYRPLYVLADVSPYLSMAVRALGLLAVIAVSLLARSADADRETFALGLVAIPFFAPQAYTHDYVALLPAVVVLLAVEFARENGRPLLPVLALWLLNVQAYGIKLVVHHLPDGFPAADTLVQATPILQPGLWGNLVLLGLAGYRVAELAPRLPVGEVPAGDADTADAEGATGAAASE